MSQFASIEKLQGSTAMRDCVLKGIEVIESYCNANKQFLAPDYKKRILCLSDGEDTASKTPFVNVLNALRKNNIILDSVPIEGKHDEMRALTNGSGGMCFHVESYEAGISLFEKECVLSPKHRDPVPMIKKDNVGGLTKAVDYQRNPTILLNPLIRKTVLREKVFVLFVLFKCTLNYC